MKEIKDKNLKAQEKANLIEMKSIDKDNNTVEAVFSVPIKDRHGEVITADAWKLDEYKLNPVILWGHDYSLPPIAKALDIAVDSFGNLVGKIKFAVKENPLAKTIYDLFVGGYMKAFSVGYMLEDAFFDESKDTVYHTKVNLLEISAVTVPANSLALAKQKGIDIAPLEDDNSALNDDLSDEKEETVPNEPEEENTPEIDETDEIEEELEIEEAEELETDNDGSEEEEAEEDINDQIKELREELTNTIKRLDRLTSDNEKSDSQENDRSKLQENLDGKRTVRKLNKVIRVLIKTKNEYKAKKLKIKLKN